MKRVAILAGAAFALALTAVSPSLAQGGRAQGRGRASIASIPVDALAGPLGLNADQKSKIKAIQDKLQAKMRELRGQGGAGGGGGQGGNPALREANQNAVTEINAVLTDDQKKKAEGLVRELGALQQVGIPLQVLGDLKLTDDQKGKIKPITEEYAGKVRDMRQGGGQPDREAMQKLRQEATAKVTAILTDDQKKAIEKWRMANPQRGGNRPPA